MKRLSPGIRFLLGFITVLLCIGLFVTSFAGILVSNFVQILSSQENLETLLRQVMFTDFQQRPSVHTAPGGNAPALRQTTVKTYAPADIRLNEQQTATSMVEWIYDALADDFGDQLTVDLATVKEFVERSTLDDFLVEKVAIMINDAYTGEQTVTLTPEEIRAAIEENAALIEEYFGVAVDAQVIADVTSVIEDNEYVERIETEGIINIILNPNGDTPSEGMDNPNSVDTQQIQNTIDTVRSILSKETVLLCAGISLLLIVLILLVNMKQIWAGLNAVGITLMVAALPAVVLTLAVWLVPAGWAQKLGLFSIIEVLLREVVNINSIVCFGVFGFGLLLLIAGIVTKSINSKKARKASQIETISNAVFAEAPVAVEFPTEDEAEETEETDSEETEEIEEAEETEETV